MLALGNASNGRDSAAPIVGLVVFVGVVVEAWVMMPAIKIQDAEVEYRD